MTLVIPPAILAGSTGNYNEYALKVAFLPNENKSYSDELLLESDIFEDWFSNHSLTVYLYGQAIVSNYDVKDNIGLTWDMISFLFFGDYSKILEIWQSNKHISGTQKKAFTPPVGTPLYIPLLTDEEKIELKNENDNLLPPWKR
jgi:hypothetical protein